MILLRLLSWPYFRKHVLRSVLTTTGIVLGVSVFVAMHAANQSVLVAFSQTVDRIAGKAALQITAGENGFGEEILEKVQAAPTVAVAVPIIEAVADAGNKGTLLVLGVDMTGDRSLREYDTDSGDEAVDDPLIFLAQPDSIILSKPFADRYQLKAGSRLVLGTADGEKAFTARGLMKASHLADAFGGSLAVMDIYAAQKMFGRGRTFDRIDLALKEGVAADDARRELVALLGPAFEIQAPASRGAQAESMLAGYTAMVNISSAFALFVGMFIVYNAFSIAVTQRRSEIGILRALGATQGQIRWLFLGESAVMGFAGAAVGSVFGVMIATVIASAIGSLLGDVYGVAQQATEIGMRPAVLLPALAIGVVTSLISAIIPARNAARVDVVHALRKGSYQAFSAGEHRWRAIASAVLALAALVCLTMFDSRVAFYAGYGCVIVMALLVTPVASLALAKGLRPALQWLRPVEGSLAADSLITAPRRTSASVAALMLSLALILAFGGMARASYRSIVDWMDTSLNADLFVMPSQRIDVRTTRFPAAMAPEIAKVPGVARVQMFRNGRITFRGAPTMLVAIEMASVAQTVKRAPVEGDAAEMYRLAAAGQGVIVSDSLAQLRRLKVGDTVDIPAPYGMIRLPIAGVILDYTDQQGSILIDRRVFVEHWKDDTVSDFRVFVAPGAAIGEVRQRIADIYAGRRKVFVLTNEEGRRYILKLTDQWFSMMNVQIVIAIIVAVLGIVNTMTVSITDRRRELGVLQAVGALRLQVRRTIWIEALAVAVLGLALGFTLGAVNLYCMLQVVQHDVAGLRLAYEFPFGTALTLVPAMLGAAFIAALGPAESAVRGRLLESLEYE